MHRGLSISLLGCLLGLGQAALAQAPAKLKPGLWEHSFQMKSQSGQVEAAMKQAQAQMAALPPEQRKMMEQMMARQGISMDSAGQKLRVCLSPEDVARDAMPPAQEGCTQNARRSGNSWTVSFECPARNGNPASSGQGTATMESDSAYNGQFLIKTQVQNKPEQLQMSTRGRWLAADCGAVRPLSQAAPPR